MKFKTPNSYEITFENYRASLSCPTYPCTVISCIGDLTGWRYANMKKITISPNTMYDYKCLKSHLINLTHPWWIIFICLKNKSYWAQILNGSLWLYCFLLIYDNWGFSSSHTHPILCMEDCLSRPDSTHRQTDRPWAVYIHTAVLLLATYTDFPSVITTHIHTHTQKYQSDTCLCLSATVKSGKTLLYPHHARLAWLLMFPYQQVD